MADQRAIIAAQNNADWYSMMFDIHGLRYRRSQIAFLGTDSPPSYHSWMTTLDPQAHAELMQLVEQNDYRPTFGIKDAFDCLALHDKNFTERFSATWIYAEAVQESDTSRWTRIATVDDLLLWEAAWKRGGSPTDRQQFPAAILDRSDVVMWGRTGTDGFDAGVIANSSKDCIGLSNCFGQNAYPAAATLCSQVASGGRPIVGYERGDDLAAALNVGFTTTGTLRIWSRA